MRRIGAHVSSAGGPVNAIKNIQSIGGNCIQIFAGSPRTWARSLYPQSQVDAFNLQADELDLRPVFIHALYLINLGSSNPDLLKKSFDSLLIDMKNGDSIKSAGVVVHLGSHQGAGYPSCEAQIVEQISNLIDQTDAVPFVIENSAGQNGKIGTLEEIESLLKCLDDPRVKVCLDTAHLFESGWDLRDKNQTDQLISELEQRQILSRLTCLHLNDSKTKFNSKHDQHANIGEGEIGAQGLKYFVNHPKLNHLPVFLEVPGDGAGPDQKNIELVMSLVTS